MNLNIDLNYLIENYYDFWIFIVILPSILLTLMIIFLFLIIWLKVKDKKM